MCEIACDFAEIVNKKNSVEHSNPTRTTAIVDLLFCCDVVSRSWIAQ